MSALKTYTHSLVSGEKPDSMVVMLHGLGANGQDLIGLARYWERALPRTVFVSPDAPFPCDMSPEWMENSFQWFSLRDWSPVSIEKGVKAAEPILNEYIDKMRDHYDLKDEKVALVGFSQGTMMSLYAAPRRKEKIAGIVGYSGALVGGDGLSGAGIQKPPVLLVHGEADSVVPVSAYRDARQILAQNGFSVSGHTTPGLDHSIDDEGIEAAADFLQQVLA
jgi:phospholipase/carboxylesterase